MEYLFGRGWQFRLDGFVVHWMVWLRFGRLIEAEAGLEGGCERSGFGSRLEHVERAL